MHILWYDGLLLVVSFVFSLHLFNFYFVTLRVNFYFYLRIVLNFDISHFLPLTVFDTCQVLSSFDSTLSHLRTKKKMDSEFLIMDSFRHNLKKNYNYIRFVAL